MNGFLAGLVQRGASLPASARESPGLTAPALRDRSAYALEAAPESVDAPPATPSAVPATDSTTRASSSVEPRRTDLTQTVHVTQVQVAPIPPAPEAPRAASEIATIPPPARPAAMARAESTPTVPVQPVDRAPQPPSPRVETHQPAPPVAAITLLRPIVDSRAAQTTALTTPRTEPQATNVPTPHAVPSDDAPAATPVRALPEVRLTPAPVAPVELPLSAAPVPLPAPSAPPPIHVRIGRVEVRSPTPAAPAVPNKASAPQALGFAAYRRLRTYRT